MPEVRLDLDLYLSLPRLADLDVAPGGGHVAFTAGRLNHDSTRFARDLWRARTTGAAAPERLTVGDSNDSSPRHLADGSLLFLSNRSDPERAATDGGDDDPVAQLWHLPVAGEPRALSHRDGGVITFARARQGTAVVFSAYVHPGSASVTADREAEKERKKKGATGTVFDQLPLRHWDRFFGPRYQHLFHAAALDRLDEAVDLTPGATIEYDELGFDLSPDGRFAVAAERERDAEGRFAENLRLYDLAAASSRRITSGLDSWSQPRFSPDGRTVVAVQHENVKGKTGRQWLMLVPLAPGEAARPLARELDLWPEAPVFNAAGDRVIFVADERGHHPVFSAEVATGKVTRLVARGAHSDLAPAPAGPQVYAVASRLDHPPEVVALDGGATDQAPRPLTRFSDDLLAACPLPPPEPIVARSTGGREVHAWLVRPPSPPPPGGHPLLLWVHGGPIGAFADGWHWRWNPQLFTARGYAVLLVNPRISTGYGQDFIEEGFARWGGEPYEDLMASFEQAIAGGGLDGGRAAAMGGSYGGYMANWIAGRSHRFRCIVSHAGLWQLPGFHGTTDWSPEWEREFGGDPHRYPEIYQRWSPHSGAGEVRTPVLFIHGEKDYRVPVSEAFQAFTTLQRLGVPSRLLYFPDENHWILRPPNIRQWHETIWEWLAQHLAG